jgi:tetratricopeptide (TPR) repeat protein
MYGSYTKIISGEGRRIKVLFCVLLALSVFAVYWQVSSFDFVSFDDPMYVKDNPIVRHGLTLEGIKWAFTGVYASNWHPLTWISHMADVELFGMNPGMHHLTSVLFHMLNSILLFIVLERMTKKFWRSALVAALFALHPLHVESVAWISERKDVLSTFFWMLTMLCYHWYVQRRSAARYFLVAIVFALGLMAKPMLVTLPFVLLLLDFWPLRRHELILHATPDDSHNDHQWWPIINIYGALRLILEKVPLIVMALAACGETFYAQSSGGAINSLDRLDMAARIQNAITSYIVYLWKMFYPFNLAGFYPYPRTFNIVSVFACLVFLVAVTVVVFMISKKLPYLITGWFWYIGTLLPVIGIVQVGSQAMADRYTYIPLIGIFVMVAWGLTDILGRWSYGKYVLGVLSVVVLAILTWTTWIQITTWKNSEALFRHALSVTTDNYLAHNSLGVALFERGDVEGAINNYRESIRLKGNYVNAQCNLGVALAGKKQYAEALTHYHECLRIKPGYSEAYYNMGVALSDLGREDEAIKQYREVLKIYPHHENANNNIGLLMVKKGNLDEAIWHYLKALDVNPDNVRTRINLADALLMKGSFDDALSQMNEALKTNPSDPNLLVKLAEIHTKKKNTKQAIVAYHRALAVAPKSSQALYRVVALYAGQGRFDEAMFWLKKLAMIRPSDSLVDYNIACLYSRQGNPQEAMMSLKNAMNKGFKDWQTLRTDPDLEYLRNTKIFKEAMDKRL